MFNQCRPITGLAPSFAPNLHTQICHCQQGNLGAPIAPPAGYGAKPQPPTNFGAFWINLASFESTNELLSNAS